MRATIVNLLRMAFTILATTINFSNFLCVSATAVQNYLLHRFVLQLSIEALLPHVSSLTGYSRLQLPFSFLS